MGYLRTFTMICCGRQFMFEKGAGYPEPKSCPWCVNGGKS